MTKKRIYTLRVTFALIAAVSLVLSPVQHDFVLSFAFANEEVEKEPKIEEITQEESEQPEQEESSGVHSLPEHEEEELEQEENLEEDNKEEHNEQENNEEERDHQEKGDQEKSNKVTICHNLDEIHGGGSITIEVDEDEVEIHLNNHNDHLGECEENEEVDEEEKEVENGDDGEGGNNEDYSHLFPQDCPGTIDDYNVIIGNSSSEVIEGTSEADFIYAGSGNDTVYGLGGNDCIIGAEGNDEIDGGADDDVILGRGGDDVINGNEGDDLLDGSNGDDVINGGPDTDTCFGGAGENIITNCEDGQNGGEEDEGSISGTKFSDENRNGVQDEAELGVSDWTINLTGAATSSTVTDENGEYTFSGLDAGTYQICEDTDENWEQTYPATSTPYSFGCLNTTIGYEIELTEDENRQGINFGNVQTGTTTSPELAIISGTKFSDENGNGVFDESESGISGWVINLFGAATSSTVTDENGEYTFSGLDAGTYQVCEDTDENWEQTYPATSTPNSFDCSNDTLGYEITILEEDNITGLDFGNEQVGTTTPPGDDNTSGGGGGGGSSGGSGGGGGGGFLGSGLSLACVASPTSAVAGQAVVFAAGVANNVGSVSYEWSGDVSGTGLSIASTFSSTGAKTANVTATDSDGNVTTASCGVAITEGGNPGVGGGFPEDAGDSVPAGGGAVEDGQIGGEAVEDNGQEEDDEIASTDNGGLFAAIASAGLGTILLWILIILILLGLILFFLIWRKRDDEEDGSGSGAGASSGGKQNPSVVPLAARKKEEDSENQS